MIVNVEVWPPKNDASQNKDLARRDIDEVWNGGNLDLVDKYIAEEFVLHDLAMPDDLRGLDRV